jgi:integrase
MGPDSLPYTYFPKGRDGSLYPTYRRDRLLRAFKTENGERIKGRSRKRLLNDPRVIAAWLRIHETFEVEKNPVREKFLYEGSIADAIDGWFNEELPGTVASSTMQGYRYCALSLRREHGHRTAATTPRDAIVKIISDARKTKPGALGVLSTVLRSTFGYVEDHPAKFKLPDNWRNPTISDRRKKGKRRTATKGWKPWEEYEIAQYRARWPVATRERVLFEACLGTGQRTSDVAKMKREDLRDGEIAVVQQKTGTHLWFDLLDDFKEVLYPWLASHEAEAFFPTAQAPREAQPLSAQRVQLILANAITKAGLPDTLVPHGLRYTFATRAIELGLDHGTISAIVGHLSHQMAEQYTEKRRKSRLAIGTMNRGLAANRKTSNDHLDHPDAHPER